jgi:hypothetical protein
MRLLVVVAVSWRRRRLQIGSILACEMEGKVGNRCMEVAVIVVVGGWSAGSVMSAQKRMGKVCLVRIDPDIKNEDPRSNVCGKLFGLEQYA